MEYRFYLCHFFVPHTKWTNDCIPVLETCIEVAITMKYIKFAIFNFYLIFHLGGIKLILCFRLKELRTSRL